MSVSSVLSLTPNPEEAPTAPGLAATLDAAEERAAIMEFDGGLSRVAAERLALAAVEIPEAAAWLRARWGMGQ